ncbi:MAG: hypothetical protein K6343_05125 [Caldisericaceae bacterium]
MRIIKRRKGFALIFAIVIAVAMMVPVLMLMSSAIPRRTVVTEEAISDMVLSVGEATVDKILSQINTFPDLTKNNPVINDGIKNIEDYYTDHPPSDLFVIKRDVVKYTMGYLLSTINGGTINQPTTSVNPATILQSEKTTYLEARPILSGSIWDIEDNVSTYLYNLDTQEYYAVVDDDGRIASVSLTGINGDIQTKRIKKLSNGDIRTGIAAWDDAYATDNKWIEIDTNTQYIDDGENLPGSTKFQIRVSSYLLTNSNAKNIVRNILAEATLSAINVDVTSSSGVGSGGSTASGPFKYAVWSGKGLVMNGVHTIQSGHIDPSTNQIVYDGKNGQGSLYSTGQIIMNGNNRIYGNIVTALPPGNNSIIMNGNIEFGNNSTITYNQQEELPDFPLETEESIKSTAMSASLPYFGNYYYNSSNTTINVNGGEVKYYISGNVSLNGAGNTIKFHPVNNVNPTGPKVDWYIGGDFSTNGNTVLDFGDTPGIVWVNGYINFNGNLTIKGSGTIVTNKRVTFNGFSRASNTNPNSKLAIISLGKNFLNSGIILNGNNTMHGIFYAPYSDIILNGNGDVFGSLIAGGYISFNRHGVIINGNQDIIYDTGISSDSGSNSGPILPTNSVTVDGVSFATKYIYRLSWKEIVSDPVNVANIQGLNPVFNFTNP